MIAETEGATAAPCQTERGKVAAIITSYNMPERADKLAEAILASKWPCDLILVDNGSDIVAPSKYTTLRLEKNVQTTNGWLAGVKYAQEHDEYFAYMFIITSAEPVRGDMVSSCAGILDIDPEAVGVHPALTPDSTTIWEHMKARGGPFRRTWMIDNICSIYRTDFFNAHPFDPALIYGHGIDLEICYHARRENRRLWIAEGAQVRKITDIGYQLPVTTNGNTVIENRMNMTANDRNHRAMENMREVLIPRYGPDFWGVLTREFVTDNLK